MSSLKENCIGKKDKKKIYDRMEERKTEEKENMYEKEESKRKKETKEHEVPKEKRIRKRSQCERNGRKKYRWER